MRQTEFNFWLDCVLFLTGAGLAISGFVRWLILPGNGDGHGFRGGQWSNLVPIFIFTRATWSDIHKFLAVVFVGLVAVHIVLHWDWIVAMVRSLRKKILIR